MAAVGAVIMLIQLYRYATNTLSYTYAEIEGQEFTQLHTLQNNIYEQIELLEQPKTITLNPPF